jgi:hypothetical protein
MGPIAHADGPELTEAHRPQLPAQSLLGNPDAVLLPHPLRQVDQPPAHDPMDRRDWTALDDAGEFPALDTVELGEGARLTLMAFSIEQCRFLVPSAAIGYVGALSWAGQRNGATLVAHI